MCGSTYVNVLNIKIIKAFVGEIHRQEMDDHSDFELSALRFKFCELAEEMEITTIAFNQ